MRGIIAATLAGIPREDLVFDDLSFDVSQQIYGMLSRRGISQKKLAQLLGCSEAAVSKNLSGDANLTLKTIAKILTVLAAEMKIAVVDEGTEGFWYKATSNKFWRKDAIQTTIKECGDVSSFAA